MSKLQKKPSALKRGHPTLQNMNFYKFFSTFVGHFCPPGSGSGFRIRIRIHWPDWIHIQSGSRSETLFSNGLAVSLAYRGRKEVFFTCFYFLLAFAAATIGWGRRQHHVAWTSGRKKDVGGFSFLIPAVNVGDPDPQDPHEFLRLKGKL